MRVSRELSPRITSRAFLKARTAPYNTRVAQGAFFIYVFFFVPRFCSRRVCACFAKKRRQVYGLYELRRQHGRGGLVHAQGEVRDGAVHGLVERLLRGPDDVLLREHLVGAGVGHGAREEEVVVRDEEAALPRVEHLVGLRGEGGDHAVVPRVLPLPLHAQRVRAVLQQHDPALGARGRDLVHGRELAAHVRDDEKLAVRIRVHLHLQVGHVHDVPGRALHVHGHAPGVFEHIIFVCGFWGFSFFSRAFFFGARARFCEKEIEETASVTCARFGFSLKSSFSLSLSLSKRERARSLSRDCLCVLSKERERDARTRTQGSFFFSARLAHTHTHTHVSLDRA